MNHNQARPKVVEGFLKEKVVLQYTTNLSRWDRCLAGLTYGGAPDYYAAKFFPAFLVSKNSSDDPPKVIQKVLKVSQKDNKFVEEQDGNKIQNNLRRKIRFRDHGPKLKANCFSWLWGKNLSNSILKGASLIYDLPSSRVHTILLENFPFHDILWY